MSLPKNNSDHDPGHTATHGDYHDTAKSPKPSSHKRVDSGELGGIGAQFRRPSKADSIPRPSDIDIDDEAVQILQHSAAGDLATGTHEERSVSGVGGAHHYSKEDVVLLVHHRDRACEEGAPPSDTSHHSKRHVAPSMTEADNRTPTRVSRAPTESIRHHTPPQPDGTTTNDNHRSIGGDAGSSPWNTFRPRQRDLDDGDE